MHYLRANVEGLYKNREKIVEEALSNENWPQNNHINEILYHRLEATLWRHSWEAKDKNIQSVKLANQLNHAPKEIDIKDKAENIKKETKAIRRNQLKNS